MTTAMQALWDGKGGFDIRDQQMPEPGPGEVVLRVGAAGICGSDLYYLGAKKEPDVLPAGHEDAGEVVAVGPGVTSLRDGDRVAVEMVGLSKCCMACWYCRSGNYVKCVSPGERRGGGFASYMKLPAHACFKFPSSMSWGEGALVEPLAVSLHGVRISGIRTYETAVVLGAGTIGLMAVAALHGVGVKNIVVTARHPQQAEMAMKLGASKVVAAEPDEPWLQAAREAGDRMDEQAIPRDGSPLWDEVVRLTDGRGADVVFECVGGVSGASFAVASSVVRKGGKLSIVGSPKQPVPVNFTVLLRREVNVLMSHCYSVIDGRHDYEVAIDLISSGAVDVAPMVTHTLPLSEINHAFDTARSKSSGSLKVQVAP